MDVKKLLGIRSATKATKPRFIRQKAGHKVEVGTKYRKPRGYHSKLRLGHKGKGIMPSCGYRAPALIRGTNAEGLKNVIVSSLGDLEKVDAKTECVVVGSGVGAKKKIALLEKAVELKLTTDCDAKTVITDLKKSFEDAKAARTKKKAARTKKVEPKETKKKTSKKAETKKEEPADKEEVSKKQEKVLINKEKAM